jgi:signal transduction histidine kinase
MRRRIFLTILAVAVATILLFGVPLAIAVDRRNDADAVLELQRVGGAAASQIPEEIAPRDVTLPVVEPEVHLALYDSTGRLVTGTGPATADPVVEAVADGDVHDGVVGNEVVVAIPVVRTERIVGAVRSSEPTDEASDRTHRAWLAMAALAAFVAFVAGLAGLLLSRHLTRPVRRLRDAAVRLGEGDFTGSAPMSGVTELDDAAAALTTTAHRLGAMVERERAFTADASHQLRTPITSLRLVIENELAQPRPDPTVALADALADVDRLEATLTDLLALARETAADRQAIELAVLLRGREAGWRARLGPAGRELLVSVDGDTQPVRVSATALLTVLDVLVDNAIQHGKGAVRIEVAMAPAVAARILVADEGRLQTDPAALFERRSSQAAGHGIGLALARSLAHAEGARLQLARVEPTTFEVLIAATVPAPPDGQDGGGA